MKKSLDKKIRIAIAIYWLLLIYIIAALVWWFISLLTQNDQLTDQSIKLAGLTISKEANPELYAQKIAEISDAKRRNLVKYIGEGLTFLVLILLGAGFVYRSIRKRLLYQQQQQNFMMAITHELKTPISVARLNLETMLKHHLDEEKQKKLLQMTLQETNRLNVLTNNILVSSQLEGKGYNFSKDELDFSLLVKDCLQEARSRYPERVFLDQIEPETELSGDALLLKLMLNNLLDNAVKYSSKEKPITCRLQKNMATGQLVLQVIDEGTGIPDNEKSKIFQKFYRVGNETTRKAQGTGLGLYLCRKIARDHHADITVTNNHPAGSNFAITFFK
jgi:two-component system, OmpR family, sensor histidine kinase CiaH